MAIKLFQVNDCEWYAAETIKQAVECAEQIYDCTVEDPREVTEEEMDRLHFLKMEDDDNPGEQITFRQRLQEMIDAGESFPEFFATSEY